MCFSSDRQSSQFDCKCFSAINFYLSINVFAFLTFPRYSYFKFMLNILLACIHLICLIAILKYYSKTMFLVLYPKAIQCVLHTIITTILLKPNEIILIGNYLQQKKNQARLGFVIDSVLIKREA